MMLLWALVCGLALSSSVVAQDVADLVFEGGGERLVVRLDALDGMSRRDDTLYLRLSRESSAQFASLSERLIGRTLALTWCDVVLATPRVTAPIRGGVIVVTARDRVREAMLAAWSNGGACPEDLVE